MSDRDRCLCGCEMRWVDGLGWLCPHCEDYLDEEDE